MSLLPIFPLLFFFFFFQAEDGIRDESFRRVLFRSDRKSTRLNSSHTLISYAVFCLFPVSVRAPPPLRRPAPAPAGARRGAGRLRLPQDRKRAGGGPTRGQCHPCADHPWS